ncbi:hypothetical protein BB560_003762 [Smittium megazygosporum]|uniref:BRCT domain-containing protein n=1 Tax=Smittium megazygosporum TaxID=133381 RepID=A0A2T9ZB88_9FUNG|nr:hypothetical protein BB560_003762 [Smittium megazygosporum]
MLNSAPFRPENTKLSKTSTILEDTGITLDIDSSQSSDDSFEIPTQKEVLSLYFNKLNSQGSIVSQDISETNKVFEKGRTELDNNANPKEKMENVNLARETIKASVTYQLNILSHVPRKLMKDFNSKKNGKNKSKRSSSLSSELVSAVFQPSKKKSKSKKGKKIVNSSSLTSELGAGKNSNTQTSVASELNYSSVSDFSSSFHNPIVKITLLLSGLSGNEKKWINSYLKNHNRKLDFDIVDNLIQVISPQSRFILSENKHISKCEPKKTKNSNDNIKPLEKIELTHLITGVDKNNMATRTVKYMTAVLMGLHIVSINWLKDSVKNNEFVPEKRYYVLRDRSISAEYNHTPSRSGPHFGRLAKLGLEPEIFENCLFVFLDSVETQGKKTVSLLSSIDINELGFLIEIGGGVAFKASQFLGILKNEKLNELKNPARDQIQILEGSISLGVLNALKDDKKRHTRLKNDFKIFFIVDDLKATEKLNSIVKKRVRAQLDIFWILQTLQYKVKPLKWIYDSISTYQILQ